MANLLIMLGMIAVTCVNVGIAWLSFEFIIGEAKYLHNGYMTPLVAFTLVTLVTVFIFHGVFDEIVLQMTICFAADIDINNGKHVYGPPDFHKKIDAIFGKENIYGRRKTQIWEGAVKEGGESDKYEKV